MAEISALISILSLLYYRWIMCKNKKGNLRGNYQRLKKKKNGIRFLYEQAVTSCMDLQAWKEHVFPAPPNSAQGQIKHPSSERQSSPTTCHCLLTLSMACCKSRGLRANISAHKCPSFTVGSIITGRHIEYCLRGRALCYDLHRH